MPFVLLQAYKRALPKLTALEELRQGHAMAWGMGTMSKEDSRNYSRQLEKEITGGASARRKPATNQELRELFGGIAKG